MTADSGLWVQVQTPPTSNCFTANDGYHVVGYSPYQAVCGLIRDHWSNFAMQVQMTFTKVHQGCEAGFKFRATGSAGGFNAFSNDYYELGFRNDGLYGLSLYTNQNYVREVFHGVTPNFHQGANQTNLIGLVANGQKFSLYLNGQLINSGIDATWTDGAFAMQTVPAAYKSQDEVVFANFQEWNF